MPYSIAVAGLYCGLRNPCQTGNLGERQPVIAFEPYHFRLPLGQKIKKTLHPKILLPYVPVLFLYAESDTPPLCPGPLPVCRVRPQHRETLC